MTQPGLSWIGIFRLGLVQTALGAIVVLTTSTLNRVMVVELALPAMLPGALVAFHYAIQISRPRWGYGSDIGGSRTRWIVGGMLVLALGGVFAAGATALLQDNQVYGLIASVVAFAMIGGGVGASGTSLLVLLAKSVSPERRAPAATIVWLMMIAGMVITATIAGAFLDPFTMSRLITVVGIVSAAAVVLTVVAVWKIEKKSAAGSIEPAPADKKPAPFSVAIREVWSEPKARRFSIFIFVSMLAYSAQDLILEPFAGAVFSMTPGESTQLAGMQHGGVFVGMILVAIVGGGFGHRRLGALRLGSLRAWAIAGCLASGAALFAIAVGGFFSSRFPLGPAVFALGVANGAFAVAAIGSMMGLVNTGRSSREGTRMGLWGAAQAIAFGLGGFLGTVAIDATRQVFAEPVVAYATVFALEGVLFLFAARLAAQVTSAPAEPVSTSQLPPSPSRRIEFAAN